MTNADYQKWLTRIRQKAPALRCALDHGKLLGHIEGEQVVHTVMPTTTIGGIFASRNWEANKVLVFNESELLDAVCDPGGENFPNLQKHMQLASIHREHFLVSNHFAHNRYQLFLARSPPSRKF